MRHALTIAAVLALLGGGAAGAQALKLDHNGRCRTPDGRLIKTEACKPQKEQPGGVRHMYMRSAQGVCHDEKGKVANPASCKR